MTPELHKATKLFAKALLAEITQVMTQQLRETYVDDVTAIVKNTLNNSEILKESGSGYLTIADISKKYGVSRQTVSEKCRQFKEGDMKIERKLVNGHNLINEKQYVEACNYSSRKFVPKFLNKKKAA